ncbi:hypothetical protein QX776_03205 [Alteromonadaceae bacterium BrNp21-10]|nr:hypothetical protein [Alteromonadaceae bacterium BrNp21-10]
MQDPTNNALTELALGLSMAFFALLILALLSMASPSSAKVVTEQTNKELPSALIELSNGAASGTTDSQTQYAFYYKGRLLDKNLKQRTLESYVMDLPLVIAVENNASFDVLFKLTQTIQHPQLSLTAITPQWQTHLEQSL